MHETVEKGRTGAPNDPIAFLQVQNRTNRVSSWRPPASSTDGWSPNYYRHIGRVLEHGKFDLGFFDDRLSMPDIYGRNHDHTVRYGIRCMKMDAVCSRSWAWRPSDLSSVQPFRGGRLSQVAESQPGGLSHVNQARPLPEPSVATRLRPASARAGRHFPG
jgi:hypothetical protein